jgi:signal transduction histidine kinase
MIRKKEAEILEDWKLTFVVQDTGLGIKADEIDKLFKLFGKLKIHNKVN